MENDLMAARAMNGSVMRGSFISYLYYSYSSILGDFVFYDFFSLKALVC